jgi:hypothetical protein
MKSSTIGRVASAIALTVALVLVFALAPLDVEAAGPTSSSTRPEPRATARPQ